MIAPSAVVRVLGPIGRRKPGPAELGLLGAVRDGLPIAVLEHLLADGVISEAELEASFIPRRTLYSRRQKGTLSREQSDFVVRLARIQAIADAVLGERHNAHAWLRDHNGALGGERPLDLLDTEEGGRVVEAVLGRIAHGIVE